MEPVTEDASKLLDDLSEDELDSAFSRVVSPAPRAPAVAESVSVVGERLHSLVSRSEVQQLAEDELARVRASAEPVEWFLGVGGRPSGPFDLDEVRERWASGQIGPDTQCWGEGLTGWTSICRVPALATVLAPAPAAPQDLAGVPQQENVAAPRASEALKELIEEPAPVAPAAAPEMMPPLPAPPALAPVVRKGVSHGRVALYVGLSATIGAITGGALVGLFAVQMVRFLPGASAPPPPPVVQSAPAPTPPVAVVAAPVVTPPKVEAPPPPPPVEPVAEHKPEPHHARPAPAAEPAPKKAAAEKPPASDDAEVIEAAAPAPADPASTPEVADDFDQAFGAAPESKPHPAKSAKSVYVPPAPGKSPKAQLGQSDIMQVVVANKDQVVKCLDAARVAQPNLSGKLLMRWTVTTSGETDGVEALDGELSGSELAHCVTRAIEGWKFPQHTAEQAPITFPFVF